MLTAVSMSTFAGAAAVVAGAAAVAVLVRQHRPRGSRPQRTTAPVAAGADDAGACSRDGTASRDGQRGHRSSGEVVQVRRRDPLLTVVLACTEGSDRSGLRTIAFSVPGGAGDMLATLLEQAGRDGSTVEVDVTLPDVDSGTHRPHRLRLRVDGRDVVRVG